MKASFHLQLQNKFKLVWHVTQNEEAHYYHDDEDATTLCINRRRYVCFMHGNICYGKILRNIVRMTYMTHIRFFFKILKTAVSYFTFLRSAQ